MPVLMKKCLLLIAATLAITIVAMLFLSQETEAAFDFTVEGSATQTGEPGDQVVYQLKIKNNGASDRDYTVGVVNTPPSGWDAFILPTTITIDRDGGTGFVNLYVDIWEWAYESDSALITVQASEDEGGSKTVSTTTKAEQIYGTTLNPVGNTSMTVDPEGTVQFTLRIVNDDGNGADTLALSLDLPDRAQDWTFVHPSTVSLDRNITKDVTLDVTPDSEAQAGLAGITFKATSEDGKTISTATITVRVNKLPDMNIVQLGSSTKNVRVDPFYGQTTTTYSFSVTNVGNSADTYYLSVMDGTWRTKGWTATLDVVEVPNVQVGTGGTRNLYNVLVVKVPKTAMANDEVTIIVKVTSDAKSEVSKTFTSRTRVLQDYKPRLAFVGDNTKNVEPDKEVNFSLSITNNGNGADDISLKLTGDYKGWGSFTASLFTLQPGASTNTTLKIRPPKNQASMNGYRISVVATSEDNANTSIRQLYINVDQVYDVSISVVGLAIKSADPDQQITFQVEVNNKGNGEDSFQLSRGGTKAAWASVRDSVTLAAKATIIETITVKPDSKAIYGDYNIIITATSEEDPTLPKATSSTTVTVRVNQEYKVDAQIDIKQKSADPGGTINYAIRVINKGTGTDTIDFRVTYQPKGWTTNFDSGQLQLQAAQSGLVNLEVTVDDDADNLEYYVNVTVISKGAEQKGRNATDDAWTRTKVNQRYEFRLSSSLTYKKVDPKTSVLVDIIVENKGTDTDTVELEATKPLATTGWVADLQPSIEVGEGETSTATLLITVPDKELKGSYIIGVNGKSKDHPAEIHSVEITIEVRQLYEVGLIINQYQKSVNPGKSVDFLFTAQNRGTGSDTIKFTIKPEHIPSGWQTLIDPREVTIPAGGSEAMKVTVTTDSKVDNLDFTIPVTATSNNDANAKVTKNTITTIKQRYELNLKSEFTYKKVDPHTSFSVMITVENKGTGDDTVLLNGLKPPGTTGWITDIAPRVDVKEAQNTMASLIITVPKEAAQRSYIVTVTAVSKEDPSASSSIEITVDVTQRFEIQMLPRIQTKSANPGDNVTFDITIKNKGTGTDTFDLELGGEVGVDWGILEQVSVTLNAGETAIVELKVLVDKKATPKPDYEIIVNITSVEDPTVADMVLRYVDVQPSSGLFVSYVTEFVTVTPHPTSARNANFAFTVKNDGTKPDTYDLKLVSTKYNKWISQALRSEITVNAGETSSNINFGFAVPGFKNDKKDVIPGDITFTVRVTSQEDETVVRTMTFTLSIAEVLGVSLIVDTPTVAVEPGKVAIFAVKVKNEGNQRDTIALSIPTDAREWAVFETTGTDTHSLIIDANGERTVRVRVNLPAYLTAVGADKTTLEGSSYQVSVKALTSDGSSSDTETLTTQILAIHGAELEITGENSLITYPSTKSQASNRQEKFTLRLKNLGNRGDQIYLDVLATSYPSEWAVDIYTNSACSSVYSDTSNTAAGSTRTLYLCVTPDQDSDPGNVTLFIEASANSGKEEAVFTIATLDVRDPSRQFTLTVDENEFTLVPEAGDDIASTAKFKIIITNTGTHDDLFVVQLDTSLSNDWTSPTGTKNDFFFTSNTGSTGTRWSPSGQSINKDGGTDELWFIVVATEDVDSDNYTLRVTVKDANEKGTPQTLSLIVNINAPQRSLELSIVDDEEEITPDYGGSDSVNRVKFKVKLDNTGTQTDSFIPELESTLDNDNWEIEFYEDSNRQQKWPSGGVDVDKRATDDLWVYVLVDDRAEEGLYPITISVHNVDDDPDARQELELFVNVTRPDLVVRTTSISLEINGVEGAADSIKEGDSLKVLVEVENHGTAKADNVKVEIYLYPKVTPNPEDFDTISWLEGNGFDYDEAKKNYLYDLDTSTTNFGAGQLKEMVSDDWIVKGGEWYIEARVDFDEDDDNGEILENNENNNDARFGEILQIRPDLSIIEMRVDTKYVTNAPNVDDDVTFTITVGNTGAADVDGARLYIWNDNAQPDDRLRERSTNKDYIIVDITALTEKTIRFRWKAKIGEWTGFRAELNPKCTDIGETGSSDCDQRSGRFIDELDRYNNNEFPAGGGVFTQKSGSVEHVIEFLIWPDFIITEVDFDPSKPDRDGDDVTVTVTIENLGPADWTKSMGTLKIIADDGEDWEEELTITKDLDAGDKEDYEFTKKWKTPDKESVEFSIEIDYDGEEVDDDNNDYIDEDTGEDYQFVELKGNTGPLPEAISNPLVLGLIVAVGVLAILIPLVFSSGRKKKAGGVDEQAGPGAALPPSGGPLPPGAADGAAVAGAASGAATAAAPGGAGSRISVTVKSPDGKEAKPKVPLTMPVSKLLSVCIQKFELAGKGDFQLLVNDAPLPIGKSLADSGVKEGDEIRLVAK